MAPDSSSSECSEDYAFILQDMTPITLPQQQQQQQQDLISSPKDMLDSIEAQSSPVAHFTDSARLHKQSTTMQFAIAPWESEGITPRTADSETNLLLATEILTLTPSTLKNLIPFKVSFQTLPLFLE